MQAQPRTSKSHLGLSPFWPAWLDGMSYQIYPKHWSTDRSPRWIFFAQMLASVDFPFQLPVGDISHFIRSGSDRLQDKERFSA